MKRESVTSLSSLGKISLCLALLVLLAGCSLQNSLKPNQPAQRAVNQSAANSNYSPAPSTDTSLISGDSLGMAIFTNRQEVLAQRQNDANTKIQLAVVKPTVLR